MTGRSDVRGDGDGWVQCAQGHRHWGLFGAAGLLVRRVPSHGPTEVLLQHRAEWSHHGGTWGLLGGARTSTETAVAAALREAGEEGGLPPSEVRVDALLHDDHGGWSYTTVLATETGVVRAAPTGGESIDVAWWAADAVAGLPLHPGFARTWPRLRAATVPLTVVVDAAGVVGSGVPARRLEAACAALADRGVAGTDLPAARNGVELDHWWPEVRVVAGGTAPGAVAAEVDALGGRSVVVVTTDEAVRARCEAAGALVAGPGWLPGLPAPDHRG